MPDTADAVVRLAQSGEPPTQRIGETMHALEWFMDTELPSMIIGFFWGLCVGLLMFA